MLRRGFIDLQNHAFDFLTDVFRDVVRTANIHLAGGQEHVDANIDEQAALDLADDLAFDNIALVVSADDFFPLANPIRLAAGKYDQADGVFKLFEQHFDSLADFRRRLVFVPFVTLDDAFTLEADVNDDFLIVDTNNGPVEDIIQSIRLCF